MRDLCIFRATSLPDVFVQYPDTFEDDTYEFLCRNHSLACVETYKNHRGGEPKLFKWKDNMGHTLIKMPNVELCMSVNDIIKQFGDVVPNETHGLPMDDELTRNPLSSVPFDSTKENDKELLANFKFKFPGAAGWEFEHKSWMLLKNGESFKWRVPPPEVCIRKDLLQELDQTRVIPRGNPRVKKRPRGNPFGGEEWS